MSNAKKSISRRFMAALLSFVLVLGLIPTSALTAYAATPEHPNGVTVSVTDQDGKGIAGATVEYHINSTVNGADYASGTATTDENGCAEVLAADKFIADDLTLSATAVLTDYTYADGSDSIKNAAITSDAQDFAIQLRSTKIPGVTVTANSGLVYQEGTAQSLVTVAGTKDTDTVTYKIDNDVVVTPQKTDAGTYAVEVIVAREGYSDFVFSENVTIAKASIAGIDITEVNASYNEKTQNIATLTGNFLPTDEVHWFVNGTDTGSMDVPQKDAVGEYTVRVTVDRGNNYEVFDKTVTSKIVLGNINLDGLKITANKLTYNGEEQEAVTVEGQGNYTLQYRLSETESWKKYDKAAGTVPTVKNAGDYTVYIKAVKDSYNDEEYPEYPLNVHVERAEQSIAFSTAVPTTVELSNDSNKNRYDFSANGTNLSGEEIEYTLIDASGTDIAEIGASNGTLTVKHAGIVTVKAFRAGNKNYKDAEVYSTVVITAPQSGLVSFAMQTVNYVLDESGVPSEQQVTKVNADDNGAVTYSIGQTNIGLSIDPNSGKITVTNWNKLGRAMRKTGSVSVIVTAQKAAGAMTAKEWIRNGKTWASQDFTCEVYPATTTSYKLVITYEAAPDFDAVCNITSSDPKTGWYNSKHPATVTPKDGEKYSIAVDDPIGFADKQTVTEQGEDLHYVYLKDKTTRKICAGIELKIKIDTVAPNTDDMTISYSGSIVDKILSTITFGYYNPDVTVTFTAEDETSGLAYLDWKYTKEANASDVNLAEESGHLTFDENGQAELILTASEVKQYRGNISFTVTDKAGNTSDTKTDDGHVIVIDTITPNCSVSYDDPLNIHDGKKYFDGSIELNFTVTEANFYEEDFKAFVSKNGESKAAVPLSWKKSTEEKDTYIGTYMLSGDGDYVVSAEYKDRSNNEMAKYQSDVLVIDTINPVIGFAYDEAKQETTITVTEHNFDAADIAATVTSKDVNGNKVSANDLNVELHQADKWEHDGDTHTFKTTNYVSGLYTITIDYSDLSKRTATYTTNEFIVDHGAPSAPEISYSKSLLDTVLGGITFGFYNPDVTVTFTSYDAFAGVDYFTWSYEKQADASSTNVARYNETKLFAQQDSSDKSKYTAVVTLPLNEAEQLRGSIAATATDKYGNVSAKTTDSGKVIVVDTISPAMAVEYSEASNQVGTTLYYGNDKSGKAEITFKVTEANFFAEDVVVKVSKNGATAYAVTPAWTDVDADTHIGSYTISGDGHYIVSVEYKDRSNNEMTTYQSDMITIDTIKPQVNVTYQNTAKIATLKDGEGAERDYFSKTQTAVVTINEHNFDSNDVKFNIVGKDVAGNMRNISDLISMSSWRTNGDVHSITIAYSGDANYTFDVDYSDLAKNAAEDYAADHFTVDTVAPRITGVSYSTSVLETVLSSVSFGFYNAKMTVTVTAEDDTAGVHQFTLADDADYIVTINYRDKSGNTMTEYQSSQMTIDTKIEEPTYSINGVAKSGDDGGAYKDEANISFNFEDQNFDTQTVKLVRTRFNETKDVTADFVKVGLNEKGGSGSFDIAKKVDNDGIYVLTVTMTDKAGHSTESHIKFTINRYGSVYEYSDYLTSLIKDGGQYIAKNGDAAITDDLVITEYNADRIVKGSLKIVITRDGETIDTKFTASPEASDNTAIGSSGWYQYVYTISKENFTEDGVYNITITSEDATGNTSTSVPDNSVAANGEKILDVMTFTVDTTAPEIRNIVGLDKKIVNAQEQDVKYTIVDVGGLQQIEVIVNGQTADTITDFGDDLNSYAGTFTLSESNEAQTVQLKVTDLAGNVTDTASDDFNPGERFVFNDVITVSTNFFVRWYANAPLFWGSIGGAVVVTAGIWLLIVAKRKKNAEEK